MAVRIGAVTGKCACACGEDVRERIYEYVGKPSRVTRSRFVQGHNLRGASKPHTMWAFRTDRIPAEPIALAIRVFKEQRKLSWQQLAMRLGFERHSDLETVRNQRFISKSKAARILLAIEHAEARKLVRERPLISAPT